MKMTRLSEQHEKIQYLEFPAKDLLATKFFSLKFLAGNLLILDQITALFLTMPESMAAFI